MCSSDFKYALRYRYLIKHNEIIPNRVCQCQRNHENSIIDSFGCHAVSGCPKYGYRLGIHDGIKHLLVSFLRSADLETKVEQPFTLLQAAVVNTRDDREGRPDINFKYFDSAGLPHHSILEVAYTDTLKGTGLGKPTVTNHHQIVGMKADAYFRYKHGKYNDTCVANGLEFKIFVLETSGHIHAESITFLQQLAKLIAAKRKISESTMLNFMFKRISVTLQTRIGETIAKSISVQHRQSLYYNSDRDFLEEERCLILEHEVHDAHN